MRFSSPGAHVDKSKLKILDDAKTDLALFHIEITDVTPKNITLLSIDLAELQPNKDILTAIGHPSMPGSWSAIQGRYTKIAQRKYVFNMSVTEGYSGGPVLRGGKA